jgi:hypothetical protein
VIDQAEALMLVAGAEACARTLADLAQALEAHGSRVRVVLALRSEFELVFRTSALGPLWTAGSVLRCGEPADVEQGWHRGLACDVRWAR